MASCPLEGVSSHGTGSGSGTGMTTAMTTALLIRDVSLVDVVQGRVHGPRSVVIEDGLIRDIVAHAPSWSGTILDGNGRYLAPGLIDSHVHCFLNASGTPRLDYLAASDEQHLAVGRHNLGVAIRAGITTVRDVGAPAALMTQLQAEVAAGHVVGPRLVSSGAALCRPQGHCHFFGGEVASPAEVRARIEQQIAGGARWVKLMASGGGLTPGYAAPPRRAARGDDAGSPRGRACQRDQDHGALPRHGGYRTGG